MRKILVLTLALWTGMSNFAYASARLECAAMMQSASAKAAHACCPSDPSTPCQCSIKAPSDYRSVPEVFTLRVEEVPSTLPADILASLRPAVISFEVATQESPPRFLPLYQLFSVYRI